MRKKMYFVGIMAQVGVFATTSFALWSLTSMDIAKLCSISMMASSFVSLPILLQIERWIDGVD